MPDLSEGSNPCVENVTGLKVPVTYGIRREGDEPALDADASKAKRELGWTPMFTEIESIIETAWRWHRSHPNGHGDEC